MGAMQMINRGNSPFYWWSHNPARRTKHEIENQVGSSKMHVSGSQGGPQRAGKVRCQAPWWWTHESSEQAGITGSWLFLLSDVKPSNVLINTLGQVKMCDFGISGYLVDSVAKTIDAGCKPYMAVSTAARGGIWECSRPQTSPENRKWMATEGEWKCAYGARNILHLIFFLSIFCLKSLVTCFKHTIF